jgi:hypothetical protein
MPLHQGGGAFLWHHDSQVRQKGGDNSQVQGDILVHLDLHVLKMSSQVVPVMLQIKCQGKVQVGWDDCKDPASRPILGPNTLKQIDIYIFVVACMHVLCGVLLILVGPARVKIWRMSMEAKSAPDPHTPR